MSDEMMNHGHPGHEVEFEHEDLGTRGVFAFMVGLAVVGVVIYFIIVGMYSFLDKYERSQMSTASPLVTSKGVMSRVVTQEDMDKAFRDNGAPMLETSERTQLRDFLMNQENQLNSYGWVDQKSGIAHIPIERAMELIVEQKISVHSPDGANAKTTATSTPAEQSAGKGKSSAP
jgi:hypothetical protein